MVNCHTLSCRSHSKLHTESCEVRGSESCEVRGYQAARTTGLREGQQEAISCVHDTCLVYVELYNLSTNGSAH